MPSAQLFALPDDQLRAVISGMHDTRYGGWRNHAGLWRDLLGLDEPGRGRDLLDFGCGVGVDALEAARAGYRVHLADISPANLELAARVLRLHGFEPALADVSGEWPFTEIPDDSMDVFLASGVLHHIPWADQVMRRAHGLLRPGGEARLMLYSDEGWRQYVGTDPPAGDVREDPGFGRFVRVFDQVGEYADWYDEERLRSRFGEWFTVERYAYLTPDRRYCAAVLRRKDTA